MRFKKCYMVCFIKSYKGEHYGRIRKEQGGQRVGR